MQQSSRSRGLQANNTLFARRFSFVSIHLLLFAFIYTSGFAPARSANVQSLMPNKIIKWQGAVIDIDKIRHYYRETTTAGIWTSNNGLNDNGKALVALFKQAGEDGLEPSRYLSVVPAKAGNMSQDDAAKFEFALSEAFLKYCLDLYAGRSTPSVTDPHIMIERKHGDIAKWLDDARHKGPQAVATELRPPHPQYHQLRQMLAGYSSLAERGGWPAVSTGEVLKLGVTSPRVIELRENFKARGYGGLDSSTPEAFDRNVEQVVRHFQARFGLEDDGIVGPASLRALNIPANLRVKQIITNMERWRWLPRDLGSPHVFVNQASYKVYIRKGEKVLDTRRVVVGKPFHKSPMFSDKIRYAEFNPTWTVPSSIAGKEMLPKIARDPGYLAKNHYLLYDSWSAKAKPINPYSISWKSVSASRFPYRVVQQPGKHNALGQVKFMFPNKFAVYLHDTPSKSLFAKARRAFSHGCIRVEKPFDFAQKLFSFGGNLSPNKMNQIINSKERTRVNLAKPIPVHLTYFTVWVDDNGIPGFYEDIYQRDYLVGKLLFTGG